MGLMTAPNLSGSSRRRMLLPPEGALFIRRRIEEIVGLALVVISAMLLLAWLSYAPTDPSPLRAAPTARVGFQGSDQPGSEWIRGVRTWVPADRFRASLGLAWSHARARVSEPVLLWRFLLGCDRPRRSPIPPAPVADPARAGRRSRPRRRGAGGGVGVGISVGCIIYIFEPPIEAVV